MPVAVARSRTLAMRGLLVSHCLLAARGLDCTRTGFSYSPDLKGSKRSEENSWGHCQQRCADTQDCHFFSYWPDRGCHIHGKDAEPKETEWKWDHAKSIVSGPSRCEGDEDLSAGVFILDDKVDTTVKPPKKEEDKNTHKKKETKEVEVPMTCPGKFNFDGAGILELLPTGWHDEKAGGSSQAVEVDKDGKQIIQMDGRAYFAETCTAGDYSNEHYQALNLLGKRMRYTTDISGAGCGCNAAMYLVSMRQNTDESECRDYYCDANNVCGVSCHEIDIQEGNMYAWHSTLHTQSDSDGYGKGYGGGDGWDGPRDFGASEYSPGGSCIDTAKPFQVAVSFPVDERGRLQAMVVVISQTGHDCELTLNLDEYQGMDELHGALEAGMTPVVSYWSAPDMLWMDGEGDDHQGPCKTDDVKACPDHVMFYDFVLEDMDPFQVPPPAVEPPAESAEEPAPEEAYRPQEEMQDEAAAPEPTPGPVLDGVAEVEVQPQEEQHPDDEPHEGLCSATRTEDCRYTQCCQDAGMQCFEKDEYWATCQIECVPGSIDRLDELTSARGDDHPASPWSCNPLGERAPGTADPRIVEEADENALGQEQEAEESEDDGPVAQKASKAEEARKAAKEAAKAKRAAEAKKAEKARLAAEEKARAADEEARKAEETRKAEEAETLAEEEEARRDAEAKRAEEKAKVVAKRDSQKDLDRMSDAGDEKMVQAMDADIDEVNSLLHEFDGEDEDRAIVMKWQALGASIWSSSAPGLGAGAALLSAAAAAALAGALATCRRAGRRRTSPRAYEGLDSSAQADLPGGLEEQEVAWRLNVQHHPLDPLLDNQPDV